MKFDQSIIAPYKFSDEREAELWNNAIFVFDSSALLELYFLPKKTREQIYIDIFEKTPSRLWIPFQVQYEYLKNRDHIIKKPITEKYQPLREKIKKLGIDISSKILKEIEGIKNDTKNDDKHPYIEQSKIDGFKEVVNEFSITSKDFEKEVLLQIDKAEEDISNVAQDDDVLKALEKHFEVGREFSFTEIIEITKEGRNRFEYKIPPGYGDLYEKSKKGTQIFGDLILWKQILEYSGQMNKPIIFVTNDLAKDDDWCYLESNTSEKRIQSPREELIKEMKDLSNVDFWMYALPQFLFKANEYLNASIEEEQIQSISQKSDNNLTFQCTSCGVNHYYSKDDFSQEFELVSSSERNMGTENQYQALEFRSCDCGNDFEIVFSIWEYPSGVHNFDDIVIHGAELKSSFPLTSDFLT